MKIISWNVNGLRAVYKRNFLEWLSDSKADVVCLQEIKSDLENIPKDLINPKGYFSFFNPAEKKGYSGTAVFSKQSPEKVETKSGMKNFDSEGRFLKLEFSDFILIVLYLPHGGRGKEKMKYKLACYEFLQNYMKKLKDKNVLLIGDFNIAREGIDLARPKENHNNTMFTPEERGALNKLLALGFEDTFRKFHKEGENYTWWPYFANARERNLGWRIDYAFAKGISPKSAAILKDVKGSDHCPIEVEISD
ncbi:MAG TPA: exodeoxyribonuclease III [archaeon]|nr:exodeoxyribonuclease III [archaeon]